MTKFRDILGKLLLREVTPVFVYSRRTLAAGMSSDGHKPTAPRPIRDPRPIIVLFRVPSSS